MKDYVSFYGANIFSTRERHFKCLFCQPLKSTLTYIWPQPKARNVSFFMRPLKI